MPYEDLYREIKKQHDETRRELAEARRELQHVKDEFRFEKWTDRIMYMMVGFLLAIGLVRVAAWYYGVKC